MTEPNEPEWAELTPDGEPVGWRVLDPDGNVVDCGPGMTLEAVSSTEQTEEGE